MDALASTEFRKRFARLTEPTLVTVNGHVIGEWRPVPASSVALPVRVLPDDFAVWKAAVAAEGSDPPVGRLDARLDALHGAFRPVPKPAPKARKGR